MLIFLVVHVEINVLLKKLGITWTYKTRYSKKDFVKNLKSIAEIFSAVLSIRLI